jgi:hypothetical protein
MDEEDREAEFYTPRFTAIDLLSAMWLAGEIWQVLQTIPGTTAQIQPAIEENNPAFLVTGKDISGLEARLRANPHLSVALTMRQMERYGVRSLRVTEHHRHRAQARKQALDPVAEQRTVYEALGRILTSNPVSDEEI